MFRTDQLGRISDVIQMPKESYWNPAHIYLFQFTGERRETGSGVASKRLQSCRRIYWPSSCLITFTWSGATKFASVRSPCDSGRDRSTRADCSSSSSWRQRCCASSKNTSECPSHWPKSISYPSLELINSRQWKTGDSLCSSQFDSFELKKTKTRIKPVVVFDCWLSIVWSFLAFSILEFWSLIILWISLDLLHSFWLSFLYDTSWLDSECYVAQWGRLPSRPGYSQRVGTSHRGDEPGSWIIPQLVRQSGDVSMVERCVVHRRFYHLLLGPHNQSRKLPKSVSSKCSLSPIHYQIYRRFWDSYLTHLF